jgi:hypothetical protein
MAIDLFTQARDVGTETLALSFERISTRGELFGVCRRAEPALGEAAQRCRVALCLRDFDRVVELEDELTGAHRVAFGHQDALHFTGAPGGL